jgi:hypothetical protein
LEDPDVDGKIILKWIFENWDGRHGLHLVSIKCGEFLD